MKTKFKLSNRILSLVLTFMMVISMLPMTALKAYAAPSEAETIPTSSTGKHAYSENLTVYYKHDNYLYKVVFSNIKDLDKVGLCFSSSASSRLQLAGDRGLYLAPRSGTTDTVYISNFPTQTGSSVSFYLRNNVPYAVNTGKPVVTVTCVGVGIPTWSWNGTSAATAVFTSTDGNATITVGATITSSTQGATSCLEKDQTIYTATATCNGQTYTDTKTVDGAAGPHSYTYTADDFVLTETCTNNCGHQAIASIVAGEALYTGSEITNAATISYDSGTWAGDKPVLSFENNVNVGTATVKMTAGDATASTTFKINPANIGYATVALDPENGTYNGSAYAPDVTVTFNGATLVKDTDYTLSWDKNGFITPETYTVRVVGIGNFTGYVDKSFKINAASLDKVKVEQVGTLTYNGESQTPIVSTNAVAVNNQPVTFTYSTLQDGTYGTLPSFDKAGSYTVYYKATAPNHNEATGYFIVTVDKATVTVPTISNKVYNGSVQTADVPASDLYTVVENKGGTGVKLNGYYDVVLELKDAANYKWSSTDNAQVTLQFAITRATNEWTVDPSITGWTYGEAAKAPVGEAKFGEVSVEYSGTTNGGAAYNGVAAPTEAGSYTATFIVQETEDYKGLETSVDFTIAKADYNMRGAKWNYREPFKYDGKEHKVEVVGLPTGVTVESYENNTATAVGDYYAEVNLTYDAHNYNAPTISKLGWTIYNDWSPTEYTATTPNGNGWLNSDFVITAKDGHKVSLTNTADGEWSTNLTYSAETADGSVTFCLKNETDGTISLAKTVTYKLDKTAPTGKVEFVERTAWEKFVNTITFGLFFKDEVTVKATANDNLSGVDKIEYALASKAMTLDEVKGITDWTEYTDSFGVTLEDAKTFVYFVRITDKAGNVTYLSTDGAEYDTTAPVIDGVENGTTYYTTQKVTVTDKNIDSITLNGETAGNEIALEGDKEVTYTIIATDKAGNETTVTVTMKPIKELAKATENLGNDNVTSADAPALKELVEILDELIADPDTSDDGEKETLEQHKTIAESLLETIEAAAEATDTENVGKVENVTPENVTPENKTDLENAKADLEKALEENSGNYTEDEKKAIEDELGRIDDALEVIGNVEAVEESIVKLPAVDTVKPDDEEAIKAITDAQTAYNALSDYEKSLLDEAAKANLDKLVAALVAYDIVEGDGSSWTEDSDHNITFVVNGLFIKFVCIKVDGKDVDKANYEVKAGSTIITLKSSYLDTLAVGEHTISVVYTDGSTDGTFNVHAKANSPATGDNSHMFLWIALLFISGGAVITLTVVERKRRMASNR